MYYVNVLQYVKCDAFQDFYSHSNWIELGNKLPYTKLIKPDLPIENIAGRNTCIVHSVGIEFLSLHCISLCWYCTCWLELFSDITTPTCRDCEGDACENNILDSVLQKQILTSGYYGFNKPEGNGQEV